MKWQFWNAKKAYLKTACFWVGEGFLGHAFSLSEFSRSPKCYLPSSSVVSIWISHTDFHIACPYSENILCLENVLRHLKMFTVLNSKRVCGKKLFSFKNAWWPALGLTRKFVLSSVFKINFSRCLDSILRIKRTQWFFFAYWLLGYSSLDPREASWWNTYQDSPKHEGLGGCNEINTHRGYGRSRFF